MTVDPITLQVIQARLAGIVHPPRQGLVAGGPRFSGALTRERDGALEALQPVGRLIKTNSPYVQGQQVTLLEVDMGQLASDEKGLQRLQDVQGAGSFEEMKAALKDVKGVKLNPQREVTVEFAGK